MSLQKVRWTITSSRLPRPILHCHSCKTKRPFESSGKFRLNANGKRLDAWLVYNCSQCGSSWNHVVFERRLAKDIAPEVFEKLQSNDPVFATAIGNNVASLRKATSAFDCDDNYAVHTDQPVFAVPVEITVCTPFGQGPRLDRLLADQLGISRTQVWAMVKASRIQVAAASSEPLRRPAKDGSVITIT